MLSKFGDNYIDAKSITSIVCSDVITKGVTEYMVCVTQESAGCVVTNFDSASERSAVLESIIKIANKAVDKDEDIPDYVSGFREGVEYALKMEKAMQIMHGKSIQGE